MKGKNKYIIISLLGAAAISFALYFLVGSGSSEYTVSFDSNGGTEISKQTVKKGEKVSKPADPVKENYDFIEWQLDGVAYNFDNVVNKNITLKALWQEIIMHNVRVTIDGIDYMADIREGEAITLEALNIPTKEGYKVVFYDQNNEEYDIANGITADLILTAKYVEIKTYTVKFDSQGGSKIEDAKVIEGETVSEPTSTKNGYILEGWYLGKEKYDFSSPVNKNITLKAKWVDGNKLTVTFNVDDKVYQTAQVRENTKVTKPVNPAKKGYKFVEWQLDNVKFDFNTKITTDITLVAVFKETNSYTVTFDSNGGNKIDSQEVAVGAKVKDPGVPTKDGYVFVEWQLNDKKYDFSKEVIEDLTIKAKWKEDVTEYTVTFDSQGGTSVSKQTIKKGGKVTKPSDPTKEGYKFVEWLLNNSTYDFNKEVTGDITLVAFYTKVNATPTPTPATPTPAPATPTPVPDKYTITATKADNMASPDSILKVYKNGSQVSFRCIKFNDGVIVDGSSECGSASRNSMTVLTSDIAGETSFTVILNDGSSVKATLS